MQRSEFANPGPCGLTFSPGDAAPVVAWHARHESSVWQLAHAMMFLWAANAWLCGALGGPSQPGG